MELVVKLHVFCRSNHIDYRIRYAPDAICRTQGPGKLSDLIKQRRRWHIGLFESLTKYRFAVGKQEYGLIGAVSFLYFWLYELMSPYIEIFGILTILLSFAVNLINVPFMTLSDCLRTILLSGVELVGMRFILMLVRINALIGYKKNKNVWGDLERYKHDRRDI